MKIFKTFASWLQMGGEPTTLISEQSEPVFDQLADSWKLVKSFKAQTVIWNEHKC